MNDFQTAFPRSQKMYETLDAELTPGGPRATLRVPVREVALDGGNAPVRLYDTSGPQDVDVRGGLPRLREPWVNGRLEREGASQEREGFSRTPRRGRCVTQLHYARRGEITPEMA